MYRSIQEKFVSHMNVSCFCVFIDSIDLYKVEDLYKVRRCKFVSLAHVSCFCLFIDTIALYNLQGRSLSSLQMYLVFVEL